MLPDGILIVGWTANGGIWEYQTMSKLGETENTYFAIVTGHEDDPKSGRWFSPGEIVWFNKVDLWEVEQAVHYSDVH